METHIVQARQLTKDFKAKNGTLIARALDALNFSMSQGTLIAIIGPDGAGKTTFMRLVAGLMLPTSGELSVLGLDASRRAQEIQERISYMPQKFGLYEDLSVSENMNLYADLHGVKNDVRQKRFDQLLDMTGLSAFTERLAGKLSGGMKQKLGLACTLVRSPELLLLDEPTVGVDPLSRRELWEILTQLVREEKLSVIVNTAYMDEAELCSHVYVMNRGRILAHGSPQELKAIARGRCFLTQTEKHIPTRILQGKLLDDREHIVDAVPEVGKVRFIIRKNASLSDVQREIPLPMTAAEERLEDAFMVLLHEDKCEDENHLMNFVPLSLEREYAVSDNVDIEVRELVRKFGDFVAVDKTSFEVHKGEVFGLLGPNGAGKTTTFRMLCGLLPISGGFLSVAGVNLRTARTQARNNIGYVAQKFSLYGDLSVEENLSFFGGAYGLYGKKLQQRMDEVLREFHLGEQEKTAAGKLPGGYKQRLSMAAALLHEPQILFLDEPTSGIDPLARRDFWRQITDLSARGTTIIVTTHFMEEAEYCDRMMIQDQGKLLAIGTPQEIRAATGGENLSMNEVFIRIVEKARAKGGEQAWRKK